tara:strand:- start:6492 stop:7412 length:921 start_codon:yes stop_codon:yes gene_type:complete
MAPLRRRHWLALAGSGLLAACASSRQRLAVQQGMLPALWQRRLPKSWAVESLDLRQDLPPLRAGIDSLVLSDGWAQALPPQQRRPWPQGPATQNLLSVAQPLLPFGLPLGFGPWLLVLRNRADLLAGDGAARGWSLLLEPSLRGQLLLPASPRVVLEIARRIGEPQRVLSQLRQQALGFGDRDALTLLLHGDAAAAVLPSRAVVPMLRRDTRLQALLPESGAPLWWSLLVQPDAGMPPPLEWLLAPRSSPLLDQMLRSGFTPPLQRALLEPALSRQLRPELLLPPEPVLKRCTSLLPLAPEAAPGG